MPRSRIITFAVACGLAAGNLYYVQPLLGVIGQEFHIGVATSGILVTTTQLGFAAGLFLLVPLGDLLENRRLITSVAACTVIALLAAASARSFPQFLAASLALGVTSVVAQILVPLAAHLAPAETRGRVVGQVMSGLLTGILLARAVAGIISGVLSWRAVYINSAVLLTLMTAVLMRAIPVRHPSLAEPYPALLASLARIFRKEPKLRRRAAYQAAMFGSFSAFWTTVTFLLSGPLHNLSQTQIGFFALAGAVGAIFAPVAGRLGDRGYSRSATGGALLLAVASFALTLFQTNLWALVAGAILLDLAVQTSLVLGQHTIYSLNPNERGRLNTIYVVSFFLGGAVGSALAGLAYAKGQWPAVVLLGAGLPAAAFLFWLTE